MKCAYCKYNDGLVYTSVPPKYRCTITNEFHLGLDDCNVEFVPVRHEKWTIEAIYQYELACGATAYEPVYKCSCCGLTTESYLRFDEPIMPNDADFPKWCGNCGARMVEE